MTFRVEDLGIKVQTEKCSCQGGKGKMSTEQQPPPTAKPGDGDKRKGKCGDDHGHRLSALQWQLRERLAQPAAGELADPR